LEIERVEKLRGFAEKNLERVRMQKSDETVETKGFKGFSNVSGSANVN